MCMGASSRRSSHEKWYLEPRPLTPRPYQETVTMQPTRRSFLTSSLTAAASVCASGRVLGANGRPAVAVIGVNGMGHFHVKTLAERRDVRLVALCDIDPAVLARAAKTVQDAGADKPALVDDFCKLLDDKGVDALVIATPHH